MFGKQYKVVLEEPATTWGDPWYHLLLCQHGHIYPHGGQLLGYASVRNRLQPKQILELPDTELLQTSEEGMNIIFPVEHILSVFEIVRPRKRRTMSPEQKAAMSQRLEQYKWKKQA